MCSTTQDVISYIIYCKDTEQYIRVLDTPGFKDTEGVTKDDKICEQIKAFFTIEISELDYVCICIKSTVNKLTGDQRYVFARLLGIFGNDLEERILFMVTFCDGGGAQCLDSLKEAGMNVIAHFKFNNSALMHVDDDQFTEGFWDMGMLSLERFFRHISVSEPISLVRTREVMEKRTVLLTQSDQVEKKMSQCLNSCE